MAVMRAIADASQVALRPPWRSCARSLIRRALRCDRHSGHARDRSRIVSCAATVVALTRAIADIPQVALRPSWWSCARSLTHRKLRCDRHGGHVRDRRCIVRRFATFMTVTRAIADAPQVVLRPSWWQCARSLMRRKLRCDRRCGHARGCCIAGRATTITAATRAVSDALNVAL